MSKQAKSRAEKLKIIFAAYPNVKEFHVTADDQAFTEISDAKNHAKVLLKSEKSAVVDTITRADFKAGRIGSVEEPVKEENPAATDAEEKKSLGEKYTALTGKKPGNMGVDKLKAAIEEAEKAAGTNEGSEGKEGGEGDKESESK